MTEQQIRDMRELDELAEKAGGYVTNYSNDNIHFNYRKIIEYCKSKGVEPSELDTETLMQFKV